jgi:hypothetical protein
MHFAELLYSLCSWSPFFFHILMSVFKRKELLASYGNTKTVGESSTGICEVKEAPNIL